MRIGKFRRRIVSKSSFSDDEKPDAHDDDAKVSSLTEDEQKEDDIARAKSRVNPLFAEDAVANKRCRSRCTTPHRTEAFSRTFPHCVDET